VGLDFTSREATVVEPRAELAERRWDEAALAPADREHLKAHLFEELLPLKKITPEPCDQLTAELTDFTAAIREGRAPKVDGRQAKEAVALAERILAKIAAHAWEGTAQGPRGPLAMPKLDGPHILPGPHWHEAAVRHKAG
jgi:predicted dehydrogenase